MNDPVNSRGKISSSFFFNLQTLGLTEKSKNSQKKMLEQAAVGFFSTSVLQGNSSKMHFSHLLGSSLIRNWYLGTHTKPSLANQSEALNKAEL